MTAMIERAARSPMITGNVWIRFAARANVAKPESERRRLYDQHSAKNPGFKDYEKRTSRRIPVITLERVGPSAS
ncbi:MAG: nitroreductase family deazaflavin-dependent oxidoreductase [Chloroflexi bacterium]|nr:MAG: nitroreductase family deazaflavin-dependent oxidoreductase [Chloroflexota bacterium]